MIFLGGVLVDVALQRSLVAQLIALVAALWIASAIDAARRRPV